MDQMTWRQFDDAMQSAPPGGLADIEVCRAFGERRSIRSLGRLVQHGKPFVVLARSTADLEAFGTELVRHGYRLLIPWVLSHARLSDYLDHGSLFVVDIEAWNARPSGTFDLSADGIILSKPKPKGDSDDATP